MTENSVVVVDLSLDDNDDRGDDVVSWVSSCLLKRSQASRSNDSIHSSTSRPMRTPEGIHEYLAFVGIKDNRILQILQEQDVIDHHIFLLKTVTIEDSKVLGPEFKKLGVIHSLLNNVNRFDDHLAETYIANDLSA
ncbi:hypothetical protein DFH28DRAFT_1158387 [Melampsora americana]|nr:hypothetical protein DFH28DRAFT_1158387 [Melampsora americana]